MRLKDKLVAASRVCPVIHKVRVRPASRSAVATCWKQEIFKEVM